MHERWNDIFESDSGSPILSSDRFKKFHEELSSHTGLIWFETSGSSGDPKLVGLYKRGFLKAAQTINETLSVTSADRWLVPIPTFHVGGAAVYARAYKAQCEVFELSGKWNALECYHELVDKKVSCTSFVPTQMFDLVQLQRKAPPSLRNVIIGGGSAPREIVKQARNLGYPLVESYGATETSAFAAIRISEREELFRVLPHLEFKTNKNGEIQFKGDAISAKIGRIIDSSLCIQDPRENGWFTTDDIGEAKSSSEFYFRGRKNRVVKVLGELISLESIQLKLESIISTPSYSVVNVPDFRKENALYLYIEADKSSVSIDEINSVLKGPEKIDKIVTIATFPRLPSGKVDLEQLKIMPK